MSHILSRPLRRSLWLAVLAVALMGVGVVVSQPSASAVATPPRMKHTIDYLVVSGTPNTGFVTRADLQSLTDRVSEDWKRMSRGYVTEMALGQVVFAPNRPSMQQDFCDLSQFTLPDYITQALGHSPDVYRNNNDGRHLAVIASSEEINCGWSGVRISGGSTLSASGIVLANFKNVYTATRTLSHELGHVFGLGHSSSVSAACVPQFWDGPFVRSTARPGCAFASTFDNYGDSLNIMGNRDGDYDINGQQKYQLGLIQPGAGVKEVTASATEQVITVNDDRTANLSLPQSIRLTAVDPDGTGPCIAPLYEIEYDPVLGGVRIYRVTTNGDCGTQDLIGDPNAPSTIAWAVPTGDSYTRLNFLPGEARLTQFGDVRIRVTGIDSTAKTATVGIQRVDSPSTPVLQVTSAAFGFGRVAVESSSGRLTATVTTNQPGWTASSDQSWATVTASGVTGQTLTVNLAANASTTVRSAVVTVRSTSNNVVVTIPVDQDGVDCGASLTANCTWADLTVPLLGKIDSIGEKDWFRIQPTVSGTWTLTSADRSRTALTRASGVLYAADGRTVLASDISDNSGPHTFSLTADLVAGQTYFLEVSGASIFYGRFSVTATAPAGRLSVSPDRWGSAPGGSQQKVDVTADGAWTVRAPSWVGVSAYSGNGNGSVTLTTTANTTGVTRSDVVTFSSNGRQATVAVSQPAKVVLSITVSPTEWPAPAGGGSLTVEVRANSSWMVTPPPWVTVSVQSGRGDGRVTLTTTANTTGQARSGWVWFGDGFVYQKVLVTQPAQAAPPADDCAASAATTCGWTNAYGSVSGTLEKGYDRDWFRFVPPVSGVWTFVSSGPASGGVALPVGTLYSAGGAQLASNLGGADGRQFKVTATLTANTTYYLEVGDYYSGTGSYTVTAMAP